MAADAPIGQTSLAGMHATRDASPLASGSPRGRTGFALYLIYFSSASQQDLPGIPCGRKPSRSIHHHFAPPHPDPY